MAPRLATRTDERIFTEVCIARGPELVTIAEFYGMGRRKKDRIKDSESMAAIFVKALKVRGTPKYRLRKRITSMMAAVRQAAKPGAVTGKFTAKVIFAICDGLLDPAYYLGERTIDDELDLEGLT